MALETYALRCAQPDVSVGTYVRVYANLRAFSGSKSVWASLPSKAEPLLRKELWRRLLCYPLCNPLCRLPVHSPRPMVCAFPRLWRSQCGL